MKKLYSALVIFTIILMVLSCSSPTDTEPEPIVDATVKIVDWDQNYYSTLGEYGLVKVTFKITNTGNVKIDYWEVYFQASTTSGKYTDWTNGLNLGVGQSETSTVLIDTNGKKCNSVKLIDVNLKHY